MGITNLLAAGATVLNLGSTDLPAGDIFTQVQMSADFVSSCDTAFELAPHGQLQPGEKVWVRDPDLRTDGRIPACTADDNRYPADEPVTEVCTVPPEGLDVGNGPFSKNGETPNVIIRDLEGFCRLPSLVVS